MEEKFKPSVSKIKKRKDDLGIDKKERLKAIALKYDVDKDKAPKITAIGRGMLAEEMLALAEENNVPLYEDPDLANLLSKLEVDTEIPPEMYTLIAEILSFVYQLEQMSKKRGHIRDKMKKSPNAAF